MMSETFLSLLGRIQKGDVTQGTYTRHAIEQNGAACFEELIVNTPGGMEFKTTDLSDYNAFIDLVEYQGYGLRSEYCSAEKCYRFESLANWQIINVK
ncbi:MAG: hypothetical protein P4N59_32625 [Negativicutes bacterium]|nr:hypothetical protein [Negativicutes bacterium]